MNTLADSTTQMKRILAYSGVVGLTVVMVAVLAASKPEPITRDVIKKEYEVEPGGTLALDLDRGDVEVESTNENAVKIELERRARADDPDEEARILESAHRYEFNKEDNDVSIRSRVEERRGQLRWRRGQQIKIRLTVRVPEEYDVSFKTGAGNITVMEVSGEITGRTGAGNILLEDIVGEVDVKSGAGNVEVSGDLEEIDVATGAGNLSVYAKADEMNIMAGTGNVTVEILGQPRGESNFRTGAGNVSVSIPEDVRLEVNGTASLGTVTCEFPIETSKKLLSNSFSGEINGGGEASITLVAGVGNVSLLRL
ncbi:MAG: DUF4097 domain-containing protein [Rhodothermaceae bacterium]|nr:DUF4097 domain-containing protein [Rhodothermaceae bacterium]MXX59785.1 DUF4097 domain-containing protein [Rhodothermaceae bacterium]MYD57510.1 DUF4097 domain-containing protein [Rhodothermaceae bacterium]MYI44184.1 DUF4097 domain-containing protein [Rhodothermaceae bacterium]MYJ56542.1 DUF4097 domain-containing protein [Rhodothermaceae bacterium]